MRFDKFLDYEVALLLAKYDKQDVIDALARKANLSQENLEKILKQMNEKNAVSRQRKKSRKKDSIDMVISKHPKKAEQLRTLYNRFVNRTFLPELRDVRRFFEQHSGNLGRSTSRAKSGLRLFKLLSELETTELDDLCESSHTDEYSSLGIISDEILGNGR